MTDSVTLPWPPKELNPNWTGKLRLKMAAKKRYKHDCWAEALAVRLTAPDAPELILRLDFHPPDRRGRDDDNMIGSFKHGRDGIARAMRIDDRVFKTQAYFHDPIKGGKIVATILKGGKDGPQ